MPPRDWAREQSNSTATVSKRTVVLTQVYDDSWLGNDWKPLWRMRYGKYPMIWFRSTGEAERLHRPADTIPSVPSNTAHLLRPGAGRNEPRADEESRLLRRLRPDPVGIHKSREMHRSFSEL